MCYILNDKELVQQAKDYFAQIPKINRMIKRLTETVSTLRSSLTSQNYELKQDVVQTSGPKNTLEETIIKIVQLEREINDRIDELITLKHEIVKKIKELPDLDQQNVLMARYIQGKKWLAISDDLNFSISQVYKIHGHALLAFAKGNFST